MEELFGKSYAWKLHGKRSEWFNPGRGFLRISLVDKQEVIEETMRRICLFLEMSFDRK